MLNHKKLSAKVCSVALTLTMVFTAMMPTAAFASGPILTIKGDATLSVDYGAPITLTAEVTGGDVDRYQWVSSISDSFDGATPVEGEASADFTTSAKNDVGTPMYYWCKARITGTTDWIHNDTSVTVNTQQATVEDKHVTKEIKNETKSQSVDLTNYLVAGANWGDVSVFKDTKSLITGTPSMSSNDLTFNAAAKDPGTEATITVNVPASTNYKEYNVVVTIRVTPLSYAFHATTNGPKPFDQPTTLTVTSTGDEAGAVTYQWYQMQGTEPGDSDTPVESNSSTYTVPAKKVPVGETQRFYCSVTGGNVEATPVTSNVVEVTTTQATITPPQQATQYIGLNGESVSYPLPKPSEGQEYDTPKITENSSRLIDESTITLEGNTLKFTSRSAGSGAEATITVPTKGDKNYVSYDTVIKFTTQKSELTAKNPTELEKAFNSIPQGGTIKLVDASTNFQNLTSAIELNSAGHGIVTIDLNGFSISGNSGNNTKGLINLTSTEGTGLKIVNTGDPASITGSTQGYTIKNSGEGTLDISGISVVAGASMTAAIGNDDGAVTISGDENTKVNGAEVSAITNTGTGSITVSGGEVSNTSTTLATVNNSGAGSITVSDGKVSGAATAIDNTAAGNVTVSGGTVSSTAIDQATIQNTGTGSLTVSGGTVSGKATGTETGTIKATDGKVTIIGTAVVTGNSGDDYAVYYTAPATAAIDESVKASITGKTDRVMQTIVIDGGHKLTIDTVAPVTLNKIADTTPLPTNIESVDAKWSSRTSDRDNWSVVDTSNGATFKVGQTYMVEYTYHAVDGWQFAKQVDKDNVTVTNAIGLKAVLGNADIVTNDAADTLTVTLLWKPTTKLTLTDQTADAFVKSDASKAAWPLPVLTNDRTYRGTATVGSPDDLGLTSLSVSTDGLLLFTRGKDEDSHTTKVTVPVSGGTNYNDYEVTVTVTATQKEPVALTVDKTALNKWVYNGEAVTAPTTVKATKYTGGTATVVEGITAADCDFTYFKNTGTSAAPVKGSSVTAKNAGDYIVIAAVKGGNASYQGESTVADGAFTIDKAPVTIIMKPQNIKEGTDLSIAPTLTKGTDYTVEGLVSGESFPAEPVFAYEPAVGTASAGQAVKIVLTNKDSVAPGNGNYGLTCKPADVTVTSAAPTPPVPSGQYTVTINGGYDATGAGSYAPGKTVTLTAGAKSGYSFSSWTLTGVTVANLTSNTITFSMPGNDVTATINWSYNGGGSSGGGGGGGSHSGGGGGSSSGSSSPSTTPSTPPAPSKPAGSTTSFSDIANHWAKQDIEFVAEKGLMSGTGNGQFSPDENMTRGMFVTTLGRLAGVNTASHSSDQFSDVQPDAYYAAYVSWAAEKGIVSGTSATTFSPDQPVTRQEMAVMMSNYSKAMGETLPETHQAAPFSDSSAIAGWATGAVQQMEMAGIISGRDTGAFDPTGTATRAEVASVLHRFVEAIGK